MRGVLILALKQNSYFERITNRAAAFFYCIINPDTCCMKKILLSFILTSTFVGYAVFQRTSPFDKQSVYTSQTTGSSQVAPVTSPAKQNETSVVTPPIPTTRTRGGEDDYEEGDDGGYVSSVLAPKQTNPTPVITAPVPIVKTPAPVANSGLYRNGQYTGPVADAYYGNVQVKVIISNGKISDVQFLDYPQDRNNSIRINTRAMPLLTSEAIQIQSADVNGVSGATATSGAFRQSLAGALALAKN